jgi:membrane protein
MHQIIPSSIVDILEPFIVGGGMDLNIGFSMIIGYIVASNGAHSIIICSNTLYGLEHADFFKRRLKALFLTILLVILFIFTLIVLAFGNSILKFILSLSLFESVGNQIYYVFLLFKWPFALIFVFLMVKLIFSLSPDSYIPSKCTNRGALFTTFTWLFSTLFYSYYVMNFSSYDIFYGSLSNIIIMMMWIYILAYAFVIGIAINVNSYNIDVKSVEKKSGKTSKIEIVADSLLNNGKKNGNNK